MKKHSFLFLLSALMVIGGCICASADSSPFLSVDASTSDRVHLRAAPGSDSVSLGLYFSGTPAINLDDSSGNWLHVMIGSEKSYIRQDLLKPLDTGDHPEVQWKKGKTEANGHINLRSAPSKEAPVLAEVKSGMSIAVLGETKDHWYYVKAGKTLGYIMSRYVKMSDKNWEETADTLLPGELPGTYWFYGGAGAWMSQIILTDDGRFWGYFHDSDMGDTAPAYPLGTEYESAFTGIFSNIQQIGSHHLQAEVTALQSFGVKGESIHDKIRTVTTNPYGLVNNSKVQIFLPGTPIDQLPEMYRSHFEYDGQKIRTAGLYCPEHEAVWVQQL